MCCGVNICAIPPNSNVQNLMLQGMILGGGAFGGHGGGAPEWDQWPYKRGPRELAHPSDPVKRRYKGRSLTWKTALP